MRHGLRRVDENGRSGGMRLGADPLDRGPGAKARGCVGAPEEGAALAPLAGRRGPTPAEQVWASGRVAGHIGIA